VSAADERLKVLIEDVVYVGVRDESTILVALPAGAMGPAGPSGEDPRVPPFGPADAGRVLTVAADGLSLQWLDPVIAGHGPVFP